VVFTGRLSFFILTISLINGERIGLYMKRWMHKVEVIVDHAIVPCLFILLAILVLQIGFHSFVIEHELEIFIEIADYAVVFVFVLDLIFKYLRVRHITQFVRLYWLDILAVFPFFLLFRGVEALVGRVGSAITEGGHTAQAVLHESLEVEKEGVRVVREVEKLSRSHRLLRFLKPLFHIPRFAKIMPKIITFFEKPNGEHHVHEFMRK
jgi:hypothetical protein